MSALLPPLSHIADLGLSVTAVPFIVTVLVDGIFCLPLLVLAFVYYSIGAAFDINLGPRFQDGIGNEPSEKYAYFFVLSMLAVGYAILGVLFKYLFRIPNLVQAGKLLWSRKRRQQKKQTTPILLYQISFILFIGAVVALPTLLYQFYIPRDRPDADPTLAFVLVLTLTAGLWAVGYLWFRYVIRAPQVYGYETNAAGNSVFDANNYSRIWVWTAVNHFVIVLVITAINYAPGSNDINWLWISAIVLAAVILIESLLYFFLLRPTRNTELADESFYDDAGYDYDRADRTPIDGDETVNARLATPLLAQPPVRKSVQAVAPTVGSPAALDAFFADDSA